MLSTVQQNSSWQLSLAQLSPSLFHNKITLVHPPPPRPQKLNINIISAVTYQILNKALKVGSWENLKQIQTGTVTFIQVSFVLVTFVYIRNISDFTLLTRPHFKGLFLG